MGLSRLKNFYKHLIPGGNAYLDIAAVIIVL